MGDSTATISRPIGNVGCTSGDSIIIAGYGLPGRAIAEWASANAIQFCVIERNDAIVTRCAKYGTHIVEGEITDPESLKRAGIESARAIFLVVPDEQAVLGAITVIRGLNETIKIVARVVHISVGMEAKARGANEVVVAEQIVATEFSRVAAQMF